MKGSTSGSDLLDADMNGRVRIAMSHHEKQDRKKYRKTGAAPKKAATMRNVAEKGTGSRAPLRKSATNTGMSAPAIAKKRDIHSVVLSPKDRKHMFAYTRATTHQYFEEKARINLISSMSEGVIDPAAVTSSTIASTQGATTTERFLLHDRAERHGISWHNTLAPNKLGVDIGATPKPLRASEPASRSPALDMAHTLEVDKYERKALLQVAQKNAWAKGDRNKTFGDFGEDIHKHNRLSAPAGKAQTADLSTGGVNESKQSASAADDDGDEKLAIEDDHARASQRSVQSDRPQGLTARSSESKAKKEQSTRFEDEGGDNENDGEEKPKTADISERAATSDSRAATSQTATSISSSMNSEERREFAIALELDAQDGGDRTSKNKKMAKQVSESKQFMVRPKGPERDPAKQTSGTFLYLAEESDLLEKPIGRKADFVDVLGAAAKKNAEIEGVYMPRVSEIANKKKQRDDLSLRRPDECEVKRMGDYVEYVLDTVDEDINVRIPVKTLAKIISDTKLYSMNDGHGVKRIVRREMEPHERPTKWNLIRVKASNGGLLNRAFTSEMQDGDKEEYLKELGLDSDYKKLAQQEEEAEKQMKTALKRGVSVEQLAMDQKKDSRAQGQNVTMRMEVGILTQSADRQSKKPKPLKKDFVKMNTNLPARQSTGASENYYKEEAKRQAHDEEQKKVQRAKTYSEGQSKRSPPPKKAKTRTDGSHSQDGPEALAIEDDPERDDEDGDVDEDGSGGNESNSKSSTPASQASNGKEPKKIDADMSSFPYYANLSGVKSILKKACQDAHLRRLEDPSLIENDTDNVDARLKQERAEQAEKGTLKSSSYAPHHGEYGTEADAGERVEHDNEFRHYNKLSDIGKAILKREKTKWVRLNKD